MKVAVRRAWPIALLVALALWGVYQCYANLTASNFSSDEGTYIAVAHQYALGNFVPNREQPPLVKLILAAGQILSHGGDDKLTARLITTSFTFVFGWVIFAWLRREIGFVWASVAAGAWWLLPRIMPLVGVRIDRYAVLEPYMAGFALVSIALCWWWYRRGHWWIALLAGMFLALSVTSKVSTAFLIVALPYLAWRRKRLADGLLAIGVYLAAFVVTFVVVYWPVGIVSGIRYMLGFQGTARAIGHGEQIGAHFYQYAPWWAELYYTANGFGPWLLAFLVIAMIFAFYPRPSELTTFLGICLGVLLFFYLVIAGNALSYYYYAWVWLVIVLAVVGLRNLWNLTSPFVRRGRRSLSGGRPWVLARALAAIVLGVFVLNGVVTSVDIAREGPSDFAIVPQVVKAHGESGSWVLSVGYPPWQTVYYDTGKITQQGTGTVLPAKAPWNAIAYSPDGQIQNYAVEDFLTAHSAQLTHVKVDLIDLYIPKDGQRIASDYGTLRLVPGA